MDGNKYQELAARTINPKLCQQDLERHALHGLAGEVGEIHSLYQKAFQGHGFDPKHLVKEIGDLIWFIAELCTVYGIKLDDVMQMNIDKLIARYPDGFKEMDSVHRAEGDI